MRKDVECREIIAKQCAGPFWRAIRVIQEQPNILAIIIDLAGVATNQAEAIKWYRVAAESGGSMAQESLAAMYGVGDGGVRDVSEYAKWNRRAAEQGSPGGQFGLGLCYQMGWSVPKDQVEAYKWFNLAAANGNEPAAKSRDALQRQMSADQITEAQQRARQFTAKPER